MALFNSISQKIVINAALVVFGLILTAIVAINKVEQPLTEQQTLDNAALAELESFEKDADIIRLRHLKYWITAIEDYKDAVGQYPFAHESDNSIQVVIASSSQQEALAEQGISPFLHTQSSKTTTRSMSTFINELESGLGRTIKAYIDPQAQLDVESLRPNVYTYQINDGVYTFSINTYENYLFSKYIDTHFHTVEVSNVGNPSANLVMTPQALFNSSHYRIAAGKELSNPSAFVGQVDNAILHPSKKPQSID